MKKIQVRITVVFCVLMVGIFIVILSLQAVSVTGGYAQAALLQSAYTLQVAAARGTIYDTNLSPLTNENEKKVLAIAPSMETLKSLTQAMPQAAMADLYTQMTKGVPFLSFSPPATVLDVEGIDCFTVTDRYAGAQIAAHVIGYIDADGIGVTGIEQAYDGVLARYAGEISIVYQVDAVNRVIAVQERAISDDYARSAGGIVLTLDREIQEIAETAARKHQLEKGAVVVTEVSSGKICAMMSLPDFSALDVAATLESDDAPLINRASSAYSSGSVFKLVSAAAALEYGVSPDYTYECQGSCEVDGMDYQCYDGIAHGSVNMKEAIAASCNGYFIKLMQMVPSENLIKTAEKLGFGGETVLAENYFSAAGVLPQESELAVARGYANFSFGQGSLLVTPIQVAALLNTIASDGMYLPLWLVEGETDENLQLVSAVGRPAPRRVLKASTASFLRDAMCAAVETGTAAKGMPAVGGAGAKTGTAQTGMMDETGELVHFWYAGYFPAASPRYTITVFAEGRSSGETSPCALIFKEIADQVTWLGK